MISILAFEVNESAQWATLIAVVLGIALLRSFWSRPKPNNLVWKNAHRVPGAGIAASGWYKEDDVRFQDVLKLVAVAVLAVFAFVWSRPRPTCDADCRSTLICRDEGRCSLRTDEWFDGGYCVADKDVDCQESRFCRLSGHCTAENGQCRIGSDEDCLGSVRCRIYGECAKGKDDNGYTWCVE